MAGRGLPAHSSASIGHRPGRQAQIPAAGETAEPAQSDFPEALNSRNRPARSPAACCGVIVTMAQEINAARKPADILGLLVAQAADPMMISKRDQELMNEFIRGGNTPQKVVFRITIILGAAEGIANAKLARDLGTTRSSVLKWRAPWPGGSSGRRSAQRKKEGDHSRKGSSDCAGDAENETAAGNALEYPNDG
jgi:hypothetical protein